MMLYSCQQLVCLFLYEMILDLQNISQNMELLVPFWFYCLYFFFFMKWFQIGGEFLIQANTQKRQKLQEDGNLAVFEHVEVCWWFKIQFNSKLVILLVFLSISTFVFACFLRSKYFLSWTFDLIVQLTYEIMRPIYLWYSHGTDYYVSLLNAPQQ